LPVPLFLVHISTIIAEYYVQPCLSIAPCHNHVLTPRTAYTVYNIQRVNHLPKIVCHLFICMITNWPLHIASAFSVPPYMIDRHQTSSPWELKGNITLSQSHSCKLTNWWIQAQHPIPQSIQCGQVLVKTSTITASMFAPS
jgi:hypothetical protein